MEQKIVIVGATGGIGSAIARTLIRAGHSLVLVGRDSEKLKAMTSELTNIIKIESKVSFLQLDVRNSKKITEVIQKSKDLLEGNIDTLIYAAGVSIYREFTELEEDDWDKVIDTNLKGAFLCIRAVWPIMEAAGQGNIITISSAAGLRGSKYGSIYCASKFGLNGLMDSLFAEGKSKNIKVMNICPGKVDTPMWKLSKTQLETTHARKLSPKSIDDLVSYLLSRPLKEYIPNIAIYPFGQES